MRFRDCVKVGVDPRLRDHKGRQNGNFCFFTRATLKGEPRDL